MKWSQTAQGRSFSTMCMFSNPHLFPFKLPFQISCYMRDLEPIRAKGFLTGYNEFVWMVILLQAAGGLVSLCITLSSVNSMCLIIFLLPFLSRLFSFHRTDRGSSGEVCRQRAKRIRNLFVHFNLQSSVLVYVPRPRCECGFLLWCLDCTQRSVCVRLSGSGREASVAE